MPGSSGRGGRVLLPAAALHAQAQSLKAYHVADVEELKSKFVGLAAVALSMPRR